MMERLHHLPVLLLLFITGAGAGGSQCGSKPADVVFVLDASSSVPMLDFRKELKFVEDVVDMLPIAPDKMRVGLDLFSDKVFPEFGLTTHTTKAALSNAISQIKYKGGSTHTDKALAYVRDNIFKVEARAGVPRMAIVLTDGMSFNMTATSLEAKALRELGVVIFVVGIGNGVDSRELSAIASDPDSTYLRQLESFDVLDSFKKELASKACKVKYKKPEAEPMSSDQGQPTCDVMVYFGLDTTGVSTPNTQRLLEFVAAVTTRLTTLAPDAKTMQLMSECPRDGLGKIRGKSYAPLFRKLRLMSLLNRRRGQYKMVAVLVIDSVVSDLKTLAREVTRAKFRDLEPVVMAVGHNLDLGQIGQMLGVPVDSPDLRMRVVTASSYYALDKAKDSKSVGKAVDALIDAILSMGKCM